ITLDLTKAADTLRTGGIRYFGTLRLPAGDYAVKTVVRVEESGLIGFDRKDVSVPAFDKPAVLPPAFFNEPGTWGMILGATRGDDYPYPFAAGQTKFIPKRDPELAGSGDYKVALFLYKLPVESLSIVPMLVSESSTVAAPVTLLGRTSPDETGLVKLLFAFKPQNLAAGKHELRFNVQAKEGTSSTVSVPFTVR
ncbi:MAG TPA: hypothetical protein VFO89_09330, partial [Thermoanaerobaculia bacterium]|nr:hypothetical protein [Thermoanaerobaculia bacterium]